MARNRSFFVPGTGTVTLAHGETCPEAWRPYADGSADDQAPAATPTIDDSPGAASPEPTVEAIAADLAESIDAEASTPSTTRRRK